MSKFKFTGTQGPWLRSGNMITDKLGKRIGVASRCDPKSNIANRFVESEKAYPNATLMSQSPDMLKFIMEIYDGLCDKSKLSVWEQSVKLQAETILKHVCNTKL